jgi:hypothetical protein
MAHINLPDQVQGILSPTYGGVSEVTQNNEVLPASTKARALQTLEVNSAFSFQIPATSSLTVEAVAYTNARPAWINALDPAYRADPTGVADSTSAFTAAIAALSSTGGWVYAPSGNYKISSTLTFNQLGRLRGDGKSNTILNYTGTGPCVSAVNTVAVTAADSPCGFEGFSIDGSAAAAGAIGLQMGSLYNSFGRDLCLQNFNKTGSIGLYFNNNGSYSCERNNFTGITSYLNTTGVVFNNGSFDYSTYEFLIESNFNQSGVTLQNGAALFGCRLAMRGNFAAGVSNSGWVLALDPGNTSGTSSIQNGEYDIVVEADNSGVGHKTLVMGSSLPNCQLTGTGVMVFASPLFQGAAITPGSLFGFSGYVSDAVLGNMAFGDAAAFHGGTQWAVYGSNTNAFFTGGSIFAQFGDVQEWVLHNGASTIAAIDPGGVLRARKLELLWHQPSSGAAGTITWPSNVKWAGGAHTLSTANNAVDKVRLTYYPSDNAWYAELLTAYV